MKEFLRAANHREPVERHAGPLSVVEYEQNHVAEHLVVVVSAEVSAVALGAGGDDDGPCGGGHAQLFWPTVTRWSIATRSPGSVSSNRTGAWGLGARVRSWGHRRMGCACVVDTLQGLGRARAASPLLPGAWERDHWVEGFRRWRMTAPSRSLGTSHVVACGFSPAVTGRFRSIFLRVDPRHEQRNWRPTSSGWCYARAAACLEGGALALFSRIHSLHEAAVLNFREDLSIRPRVRPVRRSGGLWP